MQQHCLLLCYPFFFATYCWYVSVVIYGRTRSVASSFDGASSCDVSSSGGCAHLSLPTGDTVYQYSVTLFKCFNSIAQFCVKCNMLHNFCIFAQRVFCAYCTIFRESSNKGCFTKFLHNYFDNRTLVRTLLKYEDNIVRLFAQ